MATRIYYVTNEQSDIWLVRASTRSQALAYVAAKTLDISVATQDDLVNAVSIGTTVVNANGEE